VPSQPEPVVPVLWNQTVAEETDVTAQKAAAARKHANLGDFILGFVDAWIPETPPTDHAQRSSRTDRGFSGCANLPESPGRIHPPYEGAFPRGVPPRNSADNTVQGRCLSPPRTPSSGAPPLTNTRMLRKNLPTNGFISRLNPSRCAATDRHHS